MSNEELQKAIDDITKDDNGSGAVAPAAAMPAGAMPDGMMPSGGSAADAMPASDAAVVATSDTTPIAPPPAAPAVPVTPAVPAAAPVDVTESLDEGVAIGADGLIDMAAAKQTVAEKVSSIPTEEPPANLLKVKQDALRELFPLMDKLNIDPIQKFGLYKDIIDLTKEHSAVEQAHETILQIADEQTRADALLELLEIIAGFKV